MTVIAHGERDGAPLGGAGQTARAGRDEKTPRVGPTASGERRALRRRARYGAYAGERDAHIAFDSLTQSYMPCVSDHRAPATRTTDSTRIAHLTCHTRVTRDSLATDRRDPPPNGAARRPRSVAVDFVRPAQANRTALLGKSPYLRSVQVHCNLPLGLRDPNSLPP